MLIVALVAAAQRRAVQEGASAAAGLELLHEHRSSIPEVTHVDYSPRVQTVGCQSNPAFHRLLTAFKELTGCAVLVKTSFNVRGEPIVRTPDEAYTCFMRTGIDLLVLGDFLLEKTAQPEWAEERNWRAEIALD